MYLAYNEFYIQTLANVGREKSSGLTVLEP